MAGFITNPSKTKLPFLFLTGAGTKMDKTTRQKVYEILESRIQQIFVAKVIAVTLILLIGLNVIAAVLETDAGYFQSYGRLFDAFAAISVLIFTAEYFLRVWCCTENPRFQEPVTGRLRYMATPIAIIDLLVILPFLIFPIILLYPGLIPLVRFSRIFWILKSGHYSRSLKTFMRVFEAKKGQIFMAFFLMMLVLVLGSAVIFLAEHNAQPHKFSSVLASMWWGIETMATIGYGDMIPITPVGKFIAGIIALLGVGLFAIPAGIFASGFVEESNKRKERETQKETICPHCGKNIHDPPEDPK
jgi:voltage-gated potassium channel